MPQNKIISFSYVPYAIKDPDTNTYLGEIFRPNERFLDIEFK